ncbi:MAG: hypothetical protein Athens101428_471 [Candidatus Berkelbacteria bacterium Athens1014_28]|uniref:Uncharacterized protein n=1 Tax=Candidatus Berkelbacteria bacterium Athens1014_28 TaxID=2017145 RepID=A0A554LM75_9BACT|nr:MAG: hypothetical protein Athens101428_471 [Candidatus Berkelbacteria bacterium Athens1014_28]
MNIKKLGIGLAIMVLGIVFIVFANRAINPKPDENCGNLYNTAEEITSPYYDQNNNWVESTYTSVDNSQYEKCWSNYQAAQKANNQRSFSIIMILSVIAIIAGVLVRAVPAVSWGLMLAGLTLIIYILAEYHDLVGSPMLAVVSGLAIGALIYLAYSKLGDKEKIEGQNMSQNLSAVKETLSSEPVVSAKMSPDLPPSSTSQNDNFNDVKNEQK